MVGFGQVPIRDDHAIEYLRCPVLELETPPRLFLPGGEQGLYLGDARSEADQRAQSEVLSIGDQVAMHVPVAGKELHGRVEWIVAEIGQVLGRVDVQNLYADERPLSFR